MAKTIKELREQSDQFPKHHNVKVGNSTGVYSEHEDHFEIASVRTPAKHRGKGGAHAVMKHILKHVDSTGKPARLIASPLDKKTRTDKLVSFYQKHGFKLTGERANAMGDPWMERKSD